MIIGAQVVATACDNRELGANPKQSCCRDNLAFFRVKAQPLGINFSGKVKKWMACQISDSH